MGSIILCHHKWATHPYEIMRLRIYTLEELCYFITENIYLIDSSFADMRLTEWLRDELWLSDLATELTDIIKENGSPEQFAMTILTDSKIYTTAQLGNIKAAFGGIKRLTPERRRKFKADSLLDGGCAGQAAAIYRSLIREMPDDGSDGDFYGRVYACLGSAYGRMFLYKDAASMYEEALKLCEDPDIRTAYVYALFKSADEEAFTEFLNGDEKNVRAWERISAKLGREDDSPNAATAGEAYGEKVGDAVSNESSGRENDEAAADKPTGCENDDTAAAFEGDGRPDMKHLKERYRRMSAIS